MLFTKLPISVEIDVKHNTQVFDHTFMHCIPYSFKTIFVLYFIIIVVPLLFITITTQQVTCLLANNPFLYKTFLAHLST